MRPAVVLILLPLGCIVQTEGGVSFTGDLPRGATPDDVDDIVECVVHLEGAPVPLRSALINFKPRLYDEVTQTEYAGLFWEPNRVVIATDGYRDIGATALTYELVRIAHWDHHHESLPSLEHAARYSDTISTCRYP